MKPLSDTQIDYISKRLEAANLQDAALEEELLDHICCVVEEKIAVGQTFQEAVLDSFDLFPDTALQDIQQTILSIHSSNHHLAMKILLFSLFSMLLVNGWYSNFHEFEEAQSPAPKLLDTRALESWTAQLIADPPSIFPIEGKIRISSGFGMRVHPVFKEEKMHKGIDLPAPVGTPVRATSDGVVIKAKTWKKGYGKHIVIQHDEQYQTLYAQLSAISVKEGQKVKKGDLIGAVGSSGASTGPHLHYEVLKDGEHEDPEAYLPL